MHMHMHLFNLQSAILLAATNAALTPGRKPFQSLEIAAVPNLASASASALDRGSGFCSETAVDICLLMFHLIED